MKKALVVILIAALSLSMLAFLAGCGGEKNKDEAKQLMGKGDDYMEAVETSWTGLEEKQAAFVAKAMQGDMSAFTGAAGEATMKEFQDSFVEIDKDLKAANDEYNAIMNLEGVQDYKDYASKTTEAIAVLQKQLQAAEKLLTDLSTTLANTSPDQLNQVLMSLAGSESLQALTDLGEQADALIKDANQIKQEKKLDR